MMTTTRFPTDEETMARLRAAVSAPVERQKAVHVVLDEMGYTEAQAIEGLLDLTDELVHTLATEQQRGYGF